MSIIASNANSSKDRPGKESLLATKLLIPRPRPDLVQRSRLLDRLDENMERKLTVISASAGFGKTTLLSAWCASLRKKQMPVAWFSLDEDDNDPTRLWVYLINSLGAFESYLGETALSMLVSSELVPIESVITTEYMPAVKLPGSSNVSPFDQLNKYGGVPEETVRSTDASLPP